MARSRRSILCVGGQVAGDHRRGQGEVTKPAPLVPAHIDLRDFEFMPLRVVRLRDSDLVTYSSGDEFKAAVILWCAAWHQMPAGSLPDDDRWLAKHSGAGLGWKKLRAG